MERIKKYLLYLMLLENVAVQTSFFAAYTAIFFYSFLALGFVFILTGELFKNNRINIYRPFYILGGIYLLYEFTVGQNTINQQTLTYLLAKLTTFAIIITCVDCNYKFYEKQMLYSLSVFMCLIVLYGIISGGASGSDEERLMLGFTNSNTTSSMGAFIIGVMLFISNKWNLKNIIIATIGLYAILAGGSRAGVLVFAIIIFMRYGLSLKIFLVMSLIVVTSVVILPAIGLETVGVERIMDTYKGKEGTNRDLEREACMMMIEAKPYTGWGFEAQNQGAAAEVAKLPPHNGYLETLKFMGVPMGGVWIAVYIFYVLYAYFKYKRGCIPNDVYLALLLALTVNTFYESLLVGVHEYATNIIFVSLAAVCKKIAINKRT